MSNSAPRLLIVDDDERVRDLAEFAARKSGMFASVMVAPDAAEAFRMLSLADGNQRGLPDGVLTDLSMPDMDGLQFTRALKTHSTTKALPVFMFSSSGRPNDREHALAAGCADFFEKPVALEQLVELMRTIAVRSLSRV